MISFILLSFYSTNHYRRFDIETLMPAIYTYYYSMSLASLHSYLTADSKPFLYYNEIKALHRLELLLQHEPSRPQHYRDGRDSYLFFILIITLALSPYVIHSRTTYIHQFLNGLELQLLSFLKDKVIHSSMFFLFFQYFSISLQVHASKSHFSP